MARYQTGTMRGWDWRWPAVAAIVAGLLGLGLGYGLGHQAGSAPASSGPTGPGPWRVENGVPVGYAHTQDGAVAAATNFESVILGNLTFQPDQYRQAMTTMAASAARQKLLDEAEHHLVAYAPIISVHAQGKRVVERFVPLAYHVDRYSGDQAQVAIWGESILGVDGTVPIGETWTTGVYLLQWAAGDWRLLDDTGGHFGPTPTTDQQPVQTNQLPPEVAGFKEYRLGSS